MFLKLTDEQVRNWVATYFPDFKPRKNNTEFRVCNPFDGDTDYHLNLSVRGAHDWRGDSWSGKYKPTFLRFVQLYRKCSFAQAVKEVCGGNTSLRTIESQLRQQHQIEQEVVVLLELPKGSQKIIGSTQPKMAAILINWLKSRGLTEVDIERYQLYHYADNVVWPYYEYDMLVYYQSRNYINKVFNFPSSKTGVTKTMFFYGFDYVEPDDYLIITEAIFGAHTLEDQCLASGGAILGERQLLKLRVLNPKRGVILAPDNDKAGIASLIHNYNLLSPHFPVLQSIPPRMKYQEDGEDKIIKDWNELLKIMSKTEVRNLFERGIQQMTLKIVDKISQALKIMS